MGSDRAGAAFWVLLGAAITVGALRIDRLASQGVEWFAAPGLLPAVLGVVIAINGLLIGWRAWRTPQVPAPIVSRDDRMRVVVTLLLCLGFAVLLVGRGLHFGVAAGLYLFVHITLLQWNERRAAEQVGRGLALAAAVAIGAASAVTFVFQTVFLVRLP